MDQDRLAKIAQWIQQEDEEPLLPGPPTDGIDPLPIPRRAYDYDHNVVLRALSQVWGGGIDDSEEDAAAGAGYYALAPTHEVYPCDREQYLRQVLDIRARTVGFTIVSLRRTVSTVFHGKGQRQEDRLMFFCTITLAEGVITMHYRATWDDAARLHRAEVERLRREAPPDNI